MTRKELIEQEAERMFEKPDSSADNSTKLEALSARGIFISGAQFADSLDRWVKVEDAPNDIVPIGSIVVYQDDKGEFGAYEVQEEDFTMCGYYHVTHYQIINPPIK